MHKCRNKKLLQRNICVSLPSFGWIDTHKYLEIIATSITLLRPYSGH